jgi:hypothetical protein
MNFIGAPLSSLPGTGGLRGGEGKQQEAHFGKEASQYHAARRRDGGGPLSSVKTESLHDSAR